MSNRNRRYSKRELLGSLYVDYVMSVQDLGVAHNSSRWEILREFLRIGEARAERLIEEPGGLLFLQSVAGQPNSGAIYVYNESLKAFFWLRFEMKDGSLNSREFDYAVRAYHLLNFTVNANRNHRPRKHHRKSIPWRSRPVLPQPSPLRVKFSWPFRSSFLRAIRRTLPSPCIDLDPASPVMGTAYPRADGGRLCHQRHMHSSFDQILEPG